jgi:zinc protease
MLPMHIKDFDPYNFSKRISNAIPVYYNNIPWAPCVHIRIAFRAGAFNDPKGREGIAHFLEHMIFDGCPLMPHKKGIEQFGKLNTINSLNAYTSHYTTCYTAKCLPENFEKVLVGMKDMIFNSFLKKEDVEHERSVIIQEAWGRYRNEKFLKYIKHSLNNIFHGHEASRLGRALGWPESIVKISQNDIVNFHKKNYVKENMYLVITGAIEKNELDLIQNFTKNIPAGKKAKESYGKIGKPKQKKLSWTGEEIGKPSEQVTFSLDRVGGALNEVELITANHLTQLLRDLLHERLRIENSLCYGVGASLHNEMEYFNATIEVNTSKEKVELAEKEIWKIIEEIIEGKHKDRFDIVHKIRLESVKSAERSSSDIAEYAVGQIRKKGVITNLKKFIKEEESVKYDDVAKLTKKIFNKEWICTEMVLPDKK